MKTATRLFVLLFTYNTLYSQTTYGPKEAYNDSLFIYTQYRTQIETLAHVQESDRQSWYDREAVDDKAIACALIKLAKYNSHDYLPDSTDERESFGIAKRYPKPHVIKLVGEFVSEKQAPLFYSYDKQTRFMDDSTSQPIRKIPYVRKLTFDRGRLIKIEKLNPVTLAGL